MSRQGSPLTVSVPSRQKQKSLMPLAINQGAEDAKYQSKYRELKRKVKDVEADNDRMHAKVMTHKLTIQRMKIERAILYEKLSGPVPTSTEPANYQDYQRPHLDAGPTQPIHSPTRPSIEHDPRQRPLPPRLYEHRSSSHASPPMEHSYPHTRTRSQSSSSRSRSHHPSYRDAPYSEIHPPPFSPPLSEHHDRSRQSDMRNMPPQPDSHPLPPQLSPRSSTSDLRSRQPRSVHDHQRLGPGTYINRTEYSEQEQRDLDREREREWEIERSSRELARSRERERELLGPPSSARHRQPGERGDYAEHTLSSARDEPSSGQAYYDAPPSARPSYSRASRAGSPASASASGSHAALTSNDELAPTYYDRDGRPAAAFRLRPVSSQAPNANGHGDDPNFVHEDGRNHARLDRVGSGGGNYPVGAGVPMSIPVSSQGPVQQQHSLPHQQQLHQTPLQESRKRPRNEMEVDVENDVDALGSGPQYATPRAGGAEADMDRGPKRYHHDHRRSVDVDMGEDSRVAES